VKLGIFWKANNREPGEEESGPVYVWVKQNRINRSSKMGTAGKKARRTEGKGNFAGKVIRVNARTKKIS